MLKEPCKDPKVRRPRNIKERPLFRRLIVSNKGGEVGEEEKKKALIPLPGGSHEAVEDPCDMIQSIQLLRALSLRPYSNPIRYQFAAFPAALPLVLLNMPGSILFSPSFFFGAAGK